MLPLDLITKSDELKKLIFENPNLPIVVMIGEGDGEYSIMHCSGVKFCIEEIIDRSAPYSGEDLRETGEKHKFYPEKVIAIEID